MNCRPAKSCTPQPLTGQGPSSDWHLDQLGEHAQGLCEQILTQEKELAPLYWQLGQTLTLARRNSQHGQWRGFLKQLGIEKTRASRACAIFAVFAHVDDVHGFTVAEAYAARKRRSKQ